MIKRLVAKVARIRHYHDCPTCDVYAVHWGLRCDVRTPPCPECADG